MKTKLIIALCLLFTCLNILAADSNSTPHFNITFTVNKDWGKPEYREYTSINKKHELTYQQKYATLYIIETLCDNCKPVTVKEVNAINEHPQSGIVAMITTIDSNPAIYQLHSSPKGVDSRQVRFFHNKRFYEIQLTVNRKADIATHIRFERYFFKLLNSVRTK